MEAWRAALPNGTQAQGLEGMRRWQANWPEPCSRLCCFSPDCARIDCCACGTSITKSFGDRFVCMDCDVKFAQPGDPTCHDVEGYQLCRPCFFDGRVPHDHQNFCKVSGSDGVHGAALREGPFGKRFQYTAEMCVPAAVPADAPECGICFCDFDDPEDPCSAFPGCRSIPPHTGDTTRDMRQESGLRPGKRYMHRNCIMLWLAQKNVSYCSFDADAPPPPLCEACIWDAEAATWRADFSLGVAMLREAFAGGKLLDESELSDLFTRVAQIVEISMPGASDITAAVPQGLQGAAELLEEVTVRLHPQVAIRAIMHELCGALINEFAESR
eukprot:TRINITY_DN29046_c0_g1_i1.p1 TRINITY_DN29046_c0_g1~~TRINITY_DN29046_c0_g1_i1.p1  ORF type:complete len:328 (-),score=76.08 TRINITY_DN29046_c0_g1_i1:83-1066(-)